MSWIRTGGVFRADVGPGDLMSAAALLGVSGVELSHAFEPHGESFAVLAAGLRVAMHTWPEYQVVSVDVYSRRPLDLGSRLSALGWVALDVEGDAR